MAREKEREAILTGMVTETLLFRRYPDIAASHFLRDFFFYVSEDPLWLAVKHHSDLRRDLQ